MLSSQDFGVEQFFRADEFRADEFRADEFRADDPSPFFHHHDIPIKFVLKKKTHFLTIFNFF